MDKFSERIINRAYEPYRKESLFLFLIDILIDIGAIVTLVILDATDLLYTFFLEYLLFHYLIAIPLHYGLTLLSFVETRRQLMTAKEIQIVKVRETFSMSGHQGHSALRWLYNENIRMNTYKLKCIDSDGKAINLRSAMSGKKRQILQDELNANPDIVIHVLIGKYTKIIVKYCDKGEFSLKMNR